MINNHFFKKEEDIISSKWTIFILHKVSHFEDKVYLRKDDQNTARDLLSLGKDHFNEIISSSFKY